MDRVETAELFALGRDAWNDWANKRLAERKVLEEKGLWIPKRDWFGHNKLRHKEAGVWMKSAASDFSDRRFLGSKDENKESESAGLPVKCDPLEPRPANFEGYIFPGEVHFDRVTFTGEASFDAATFEGDAWFRDATFKGDARFKSATFKGGAVFDRSIFKGDALFRSALFTGHTWFDSVCFCRAASFYSVQAKHGFALLNAHFRRQVPDFISARFKEPVILDHIQLGIGVEPGGLLRSLFGGLYSWLFGKPDRALSTKYRALKRLAIQSDDHRNEQIFFRGELRVRRYNEDKPWHLGFLLGIIYELVSGFGHSIIRPLLWLLVLFLLSSWFYLSEYTPAGTSPRAYIQAQLLSHLPDSAYTLVPALRPEALPPLTCKDEGSGDPAASAIMLALKKNSVFAGFDTAEKSTRLYACLYGYDDDHKTPRVPNAVVLWGIWQTFLSTALLFLFLLGLRNRFKIK
jgi:hypothetical protein